MTPQEKLNYCARVRSRLARRPRNVEYAHISKATGLGIDWLKAFARSKHEFPGIDKVEKVELFLNSLRDA